MRMLLRHKLLVGAVALVAAASAGGAYAATQASTNSRQAYLNDVAKRLNVSPATLRSALKGALIDRLNAMVNAGQITRAQANRIEQRLNQSGRLPFFFSPGLRFGPRPNAFFGAGTLAGAAKYLGLTKAQLRSDLRSGQSLAQIAKAQGKSVSGLEQAIVAAETTRLNKLESKGVITKAQEQQALSDLSARVSALVNNAGFKMRRFGRALHVLPGEPHPQLGPMMPPMPAPAGGQSGSAGGQSGSAGGPPGPGFGPPPSA